MNLLWYGLFKSRIYWKKPKLFTFDPEERLQLKNSIHFNSFLSEYCFLYYSFYLNMYIKMAQSAGAVEYNDFISTEG